MKKVIRLTESDLIRLVKRVIREQNDWSEDDENEIRTLHRMQGDISRKAIEDKTFPFIRDYRVDGEYTDDTYDRFNQDFDKWGEESGHNELGRKAKTIADRRPKIKEPGITRENKWEIIGQLQDKLQNLNDEMPRYNPNSDEDFESVKQEYSKWESKVNDLKNKIGRIVSTEI
jgi:IS5 family transposase